MARDPGEHDAGVAPATAADLDAIVAIEQHRAQSAAARVGRDRDDVQVDRVIGDPEVCEPEHGAVAARPQHDQPRLREFELAREHHARARRREPVLLDRDDRVEIGRRRGRYAGVVLEVRASNAPAQALYRRAGFVVDGRRPRYYPDGEDAVLMSRAFR